MTRPYVVIRAFSPAVAIDYYEQQLLRRGVDVDHLRQQIHATRAAGPSETIVAQHATTEAAERDAASRHAAPGVTYRAEWCDIGDLDAHCEHGYRAFDPCTDCAASVAKGAL